MNNIIDLSNDSDGSHLAQINPTAQNEVKDMLSKSQTNNKDPRTESEKFENIIYKVSKPYFKVMHLHTKFIF
jgi:hypothetical protein